MLSKIYKYFLRGVLRILPVIMFPQLNVWIFRQLGFDISGDARIYSSAQIFGNITVNIGNESFIGHQTIITGGLAKVEIGSYCDISDRVSIVCGSHEIDSIGKRTAGKGIGKDIIIGDGVWVGYGAIILPGVTIGNKAIIAAGSVVNKDVEEGTIVGGNPIRMIRKIDHE